MHPGSKGSSSGFAAAAKVLFDSAQRSGAVKAIGSSSKEYAHQLKRMQSQSKKRGGSLGGVSYKVAEFLASQRAPSPKTPRRGAYRSTAVKVPLIDIPLVKTPPPPVSEHPCMEKTPVNVAAPPSASESVPAAPTAPPQAGVPVSAPKEANLISHLGSADDAITPEILDVVITEDRPLFFVRPLAEDPSPSAGAVKQKVDIHASSPVKKPARPSLSVPITSHTPSEPVSIVPPVLHDAEMLSVDSWEMQREREIVRLRQQQEEAERERLAVVREEEHRTLGLKWLEERSRVMNSRQSDADEMKLLRNMYFSACVYGALKDFQGIVEIGTRASPLLSAAAAVLLRRIAEADHASRESLFSTALKLMKKARMSPDEVTKAKLRFLSGEPFVEAFRTLSPAAKNELGRPLIQKAAVMLINSGSWEEALSLVESSRPYVSDKLGSTELHLLKHVYRLDSEARNSVSEYVRQSLQSSGRLGTEGKLALARTESGDHRRNMLMQLASSDTADEEVYAELILRSRPESVQTHLDEMAKRGLSTDDPVVLGALAMKTISADSPMDTFKEIDRQSQLIGLRPMHLMAILRVARLAPTEEVLRASVAIVLQAPKVHCKQMMRKLLPLLYRNSMFEEIVSLADHYKQRVPLATALPNAIAFVNEALRSVGREPLTSLTVADINYTPVPESSSSTGSSRTLAEHADLSSLSERMLTYAKDRKWESALEIVYGLPVYAGNDAAATLTLIFNCALSAAVDHPEVVQSVYGFMNRQNVPRNPTSVNIVLSSLSTSTMWEQAVSLFHDIDATSKDTNTYLLQLSLLGKHDLWEDAIGVFSEFQKIVAKPPVALFTVAIGAVVPHSWSMTLKLFQDMLSFHGTAVKDNVVNQVIRCLEKNGRTAEVVRLEKEVEKRRRKKR